MQKLNQGTFPQKGASVMGMSRNQIRSWKQIRASKVSSGTQAGPHNKCRATANCCARAAKLCIEPISCNDEGVALVLLMLRGER
jgi:hypothetical protein